MRIIYGVHGYGRGHATRSMAVIDELRQHHEVRVIAGGDAYELLCRRYPVLEVDCLRWHYGKSGRRSAWTTLRSAAPQVRDIFTRGPVWQRVADEMQRFVPQVVISDAEAWTHRVARTLSIPRISFDHAGIMAFCRPPLDTLDDIRRRMIDANAYKGLMGTPQRKLVSSFFKVPVVDDSVAIVPPIMRDEIYRTPASQGDHVLVYLNNGRVQWTPRLRQALLGAGVPVRVYGVADRGGEGPITFRPVDNQGFIDDLSSCRAVVSTAGNQLVGEAMHYGKAMLVMPEECVEQRMNALAIAREGVGEWLPSTDITAARVASFLARAARYGANALSKALDGRREAMLILERWFAELAPDYQPRVQVARNDRQAASSWAVVHAHAERQRAVSASRGSM
ncbi:MAG: glycosyltransferase family protein [Myxococcota bacterium]